jgi:hypothetical protein
MASQDTTRAERHPRAHPAVTPTALTQPERIALFLASMHKERVGVLLPCFADGPRAAAEGFAARTLSWDSSTRQARLQHEFGLYDDALGRLRALIVEAPPALRHVLVASLPAQWQESFPHLKARPTGRPPAPALVAVAQRLLREAVR